MPRRQSQFHNGCSFVKLYNESLSRRYDELLEIHVFVQSVRWTDYDVTAVIEEG